MLEKALYLGADHAGYPLKQQVYDFLIREETPVVDCGTYDVQTVDYPDYILPVVSALKTNPHARGILICGSGVGMVIGANRFPWIRAALCVDPKMAQLARLHNDANILCLGGRFLNFQKAQLIVSTFLSTSGVSGRHLRRLDKVSALFAGQSKQES